MNISAYRQAFSVNVIEVDGFVAGDVQQTLSRSNYVVQSSRWSDTSKLLSEPPHVVVTYWRRGSDDLQQSIQHLKWQLPETHVVVLVPEADLKEAYKVLADVAYDILCHPLVSELALLKAVDRATERDFFMYACEQKAIELPQLDASVQPDADFQGFLRDLATKRSQDEIIEVAFKRAAQLVPGVELVFLKYIANRRSLLLTAQIGFTGVETAGVGVDFNELEPFFRPSDLRTPEKLRTVCELTQTLFGRSQFHSSYIDLHQRPMGIILRTNHLENEVANQKLDVLWLQAQTQLQLLDLQRRLHVVSPRDETTDVLNRQGFLEAIHLEIGRARRTQLPVSLVLVRVDSLPRVSQEFGRDDADLLLRIVAKIFRKHSRLNDIVGRTGSDEFGLLLPHTPHQGAAVKAERVRRMIESADFDRVIREVGGVTISCGVTEYPTLCRDADELFSSADTALFEASRNTGNRVCLATVPEGFVVDFVIPEPSWLKAEVR